MLRSVLPEMARVADTSKPVRFLETELRRLARFTRRYSSSHPDSRKFVDILAEVPLISGENAWILLHAEIQGRGGKENFPLRMHRHRCLLEGRYNRPVAGLAILVQPISADQAEGIYCWEGYGSRVLYEYPVFKIYEGDENALRKSNNPFDLAHSAGMQAWKQRGSDTRKLDYMKLLLAELERRGWSHETKMALLWFIEGVMHIEDDSAWNEGGQVGGIQIFSAEQKTLGDAIFLRRFRDRRPTRLQEVRRSIFSLILRSKDGASSSSSFTSVRLNSMEYFRSVTIQAPV